MSSRPQAYVAARYAAGEDGKTLLVGLRGGEALFAVAAGLQDAQDRERFAVLSRYLLRRDHADGYWLAFVADVDGCEQLVTEEAGEAGRVCQCAPVQRDAAGAFLSLAPSRALGDRAPLGDLLDGGQSLAGLMRRELDRLAEALAQPLP